jgi:hypothetical protein
LLNCWNGSKFITSEEFIHLEGSILSTHPAKFSKIFFLVFVSAYFHAAFVNEVRADFASLDLKPTAVLLAANDSKKEDLRQLGFSDEEIKPDREAQKLLEKRSSMLQTHQYLAFGTFALLTASLLTPESNIDLHKILGLTTAAAYGTTAYFSIFAPTPPGFKASGGTVWHKRLAWVHGIGMIVTPILGMIRYNQKEKGRAISGLGKLHPVSAITTYAAFTVALTIMTF